MKQNILVGLFVVQVLVIALFWFVSAGGVQAPEEFLEFDTFAVDRLVVSSADETIELAKQDTQWVLPDGNPVDGEKVDRVIVKLADSGADWPIATSQSAAKRFEVSDSKFQKHITLFSGETVLADVYFGTSPIFRKVHARQANEAEIYAIEFSNYEAGTSPSSWLDKKLLQPSGTIVSFEQIGVYKLVQSEGKWTTDSETELDESKVRSYIDRFESLTVFDINDSDLTEATTQTQFSIEDEEGVYVLTIYHFDGANDWVAVSDRRGSQYGVASYIGSELVKELADLAPDEEVDSESDEEIGDDMEEILIEAD